MLGDPDCAFLYHNESDFLHGIFHWIRTADFKKVLDLLPKTEKSSGGTDKKNLAVYLLIALLLVSQVASRPGPDSGEIEWRPAARVPKDTLSGNDRLCLPQTSLQRSFEGLRQLRREAHTPPSSHRT
jgi:hypothetical protein